MKKQLKLINRDSVLFIITSAVSLSALVYFYMAGNLNLMNYDAVARLNIARKVIDNITPGIGQLGGMWLPLPQVLFIPFIWIDALWHTGFAGAIISTASFVAGALYLEKTVYLLTRSRNGSFLAWFMFVSNQNILLFQTSAMSESFYLCTIILILYFLTKWTVSRNTVHLLSSAFFIMICTLTRYEGYFIFAGSMIAVFLVLMIFHRLDKKTGEIESSLLLFITIAAYGIFLWCLYCALFFKDPLYWLHYYSQAAVIPMGPALDTAPGYGADIWQSFTAYSHASVWMNGIINSVLGFLGFFFLAGNMLQKKMKKNSIAVYIPVIVLFSFLFPLLVFGYMKGLIPKITYPTITVAHLFNKLHNVYYDWASPNIRYGMTTIPFIAVFAGYLASKSRLAFMAAMIFVCYQVFTNFYTPLYLQFSIPKAAKYMDLPAADWLKTHYDSGLILISSSKHEDTIFQTELPYNRFIHEGTQEYWSESLQNPETHARWVVLSEVIIGDKVFEQLAPVGRDILKQNYELVYSRGKYKIYKLL